MSQEKACGCRSRCASARETRPALVGVGVRGRGRGRVGGRDRGRGRVKGQGKC